MTDSKIIIGTAESGKKITLDIERALETRILSQGNSGAGKSHLIRKILELTHGKVQHVIYDVDGDFTTLREQFDYIIAGPEGDIAADPRTAAVLSERVMELRCSIIVNLSEMNRSEQREYISASIRGFLGLRRELWNPCFFVIDEVHLFAPQSGTSEYASTTAIADLCTQGRKRQFMALLATQRLSTVHKDAAAQCENVLIGKTFLDLDVKRASEILQLGKSDQHKLRNLPRGHFFAFGEAFGLTGIEKVLIGDTITKPPPRGKKRADYVAPPARGEVLSILNKLGDLPKQAKERNETIESLREQVQTLQKQVRVVPPIDPGLLKQRNDLLIQMQGIRDRVFAAKETVDAEMRALVELSYGIPEGMSKDFMQAINEHKADTNWTETFGEAMKKATDMPAYGKQIICAPQNVGIVQKAIDAIPELPKLSPACKKLIQAICQFYPRSLTWRRALLIAGISVKSSNSTRFKRELHEYGLIHFTESGNTQATFNAMQLYSNGQSLPSDLPSLIKAIQPMFDPTINRVLDAALKHGLPKRKEQLLAWAEISPTSSNTTRVFRELEDHDLFSIEGTLVNWHKDLM